MRPDAGPAMFRIPILQRLHRPTFPETAADDIIKVYF